MAIVNKYRLIERMTRNDAILLAYNKDGDGGDFYRENGHLNETLDFMMEQSDKVRDVILAAALRYLRKYEVQKQEFIKTIYNQD